jgi:Ribonucleotide reductase, beta subunit
MAIGYFSAAEGIVGDNIQHVTRELVTAPELRSWSWAATPTRRIFTLTRWFI